MAELRPALQQARLSRVRRRGRVGPRRSRRWSARTAAPSRPARLDTDTGKIREIDLVRRPARAARASCAAGRPTSARVQCQQLPRRSRSSTPSASARTASSAARRSSSTTTRSSPRSGPRALLPFTVDAGADARGDAQVVRPKWFAPGKFKTRACSTPCAASVHSVLDLRRPRARAWQAESGTYYYTTETRPRRGRQDGHAPGPARALAAGRGRARALLRRRADARHPGASPESAAADRALPHHETSCPTTPPISRVSWSSTTRSC